LLEVKEFPTGSLEEIKRRATLAVPGVPLGEFGPRRLTKPRRAGREEAEGLHEKYRFHAQP
jgi:hypothetical protein